MSAAEIIQQIKQLPHEEQEEIRRYFAEPPSEEHFAPDPDAARAAAHVFETYDNLLRKLAQ